MGHVNDSTGTRIPPERFRRGRISGWGVRRALSEGERVRRTEKNETGGCGSGILLR